MQFGKGVPGLGMGPVGARPGPAEFTGGAEIIGRERAHAYHYPAASNEDNYGTGGKEENFGGNIQQRLETGMPGGVADRNGVDAVPSWYMNAEAPPVPYDGPSPLKDHLKIKQEVEQAARRHAWLSGGEGASAVVHSAGDLSAEVEYTKVMKDKAELAKFDDYVSSMINPREPGNLQWLMEVYPNFVTRRLQHAHTEYEFALKKQMIDQWGVNTFDDLHFLYMCDQGKFENMPLLMRQRGAGPEDQYAPGFLSPHNPRWSEKFLNDDDGENSHKYMGLPYSSAQHGRRLEDKNAWRVNRVGAKRPMAAGSVSAFPDAVYQYDAGPVD